MPSPRTRRRLACAGVLGSMLFWPSAFAQDGERWRAMNRPVEPFRILGSLYYVGASDVTSYLITTPDGHILIDGGFAETAPLIRESVSKLGFELADVRILLNSHGHFDHAGGLARLKELTGAVFVASTLEAPLLERGGLGDDLIGDEGPYDPIRVDRRVEDGDTVELGGVTLTAHVTAGHTRGCTSWSMNVREGDRSYLAVSICSLSILPGVDFVDEPTYPGIAGDFVRSFEILESLPADVFLASHAGFFNMADKRARLDAGEGPNPFIDADGYRAFVARAKARFLKQLAREQGGAIWEYDTGG